MLHIIRTSIIIRRTLFVAALSPLLYLCAMYVAVA